MNLLTDTKENLTTLKNVRKDTCGKETKTLNDFWVAPEILKLSTSTYIRLRCL